MSLLLEAYSIVKGAIALAQQARLIASEIKASRGLMHTCKIYEDCLTTLLSTLEEKRNMILGKEDSLQARELYKSYESVSQQIQLDCKLLEQIFNFSSSLEKQSGDKGYVRNALRTIGFAIAGKEKEIKQLEEELLNRVTTVTTLMLKDVWKTNVGGLDVQIVDALGDVDGAMFWCGNFQSNKSTSFRLFAEAYQAYISHTFLFKRIDRASIAILLRHSLLDNSNTLGDDAEITIPLFKAWLGRFGPMAETLRKACVVSFPNIGRNVPWFHKTLDRIGSERLIEKNMASQSADGLSAEQLFVVRYSSDPSFHFVISTKPPSSPKVEHFTVINSVSGYAITVGKTRSTSEVFESIHELCQKQILNKLFEPIVGKPIKLIRALDEWDAIFAKAIVDLPPDHYNSIDDLNSAMEGVKSLDEDYSNIPAKAPLSFKTTFQSSQEKSNATQDSTTAISSSVSRSDGKIIGLYMVREGLKLLEESIGQERDEKVQVKIAKIKEALKTLNDS